MLKILLASGSFQRYQLDLIVFAMHNIIAFQGRL